MGYHISRQRYRSDNCLYLEVACGGKKNSGKDFLNPRYEGEGKTLTDPRDAINIAEKMHRRWHMDYSDENKRLIIVGLDKPLTFEFTTAGIAAAKNWASKIFLNMEKCGLCLKVLGNREKYQLDDIKNTAFCSEMCAARKYHSLFGVEPPRIAPSKKK